MSLFILLPIVVGLVLLVYGADLLVRGASALALALGVTPLVIGLTVVAYGTSAPELAVSIQAALQGRDNIAVANVVGSNIFNILFILGSCALIAPLTVSRQIVRFDLPVSLGLTLILAGLSLDGRLSTLDALIFVGALVVYSIGVFRSGLAANAEESQEVEKHPQSFKLIVPFLGVSSIVGWNFEMVNSLEGGLAVLGAGAFIVGPRTQTKTGQVLTDIGLLILGLSVLVIGAGYLVSGAVTVAQLLGVSDTIIGLTIVSVGTSLPEVATSIVAAYRGQRDIAVGNVVGSNIYNILAILGISALVAPNGLAVAPEMVTLNIPFLLAVTAMIIPICRRGYQISRIEGGFLLALYVCYTLYLIKGATVAG